MHGVAHGAVRVKREAPATPCAGCPRAFCRPLAGVAGGSEVDVGSRLDFVGLADGKGLVLARVGRLPARLDHVALGQVEEAVRERVGRLLDDAQLWRNLLRQLHRGDEVRGRQLLRTEAVDAGRLLVGLVGFALLGLLLCFAQLCLDLPGGWFRWWCRGPSATGRV